MADYIVVPGKIEIFVACNFSYQIAATPSPINVSPGQLRKLGESADEITIAIEQLNYAVPGDRNGGRAGDPIEEQFMGMQASTNLELSVFDPDVANALLRGGGVMGLPGIIPQSAVGDLWRKDHSYVFLFDCTVDPTRSIKFPCTVVQRGQPVSGGTKFEMMRISLSMHKSPIGHWIDPDAENLSPGTLYVQDEAFFTF